MTWAFNHQVQPACRYHASPPSVALSAAKTQHAPCCCLSQAWSLLSLFVAVICGFVLSPLPSGAWALLGASVGLLTHTLDFQGMFAASNNTVVWLVVISFFLAKVCVGRVSKGLFEGVVQCRP